MPDASVTKGEESFRESLKDTLTILQGLSPHCSSLEEMIGMIEPAFENDGILRLIIAQVTGKKAR